jgi:phage shock protein PspC (stress-responsive transcriptional regulator)
MVERTRQADNEAMETETDTIEITQAVTGDKRMKWWEVPVARDRDEGKVGGVVAGLSRAYGFDLRTTRIAVVIATVVLPVLALAYAVAWVLLPEQLEHAVPLRSVVTDRRRLPLMVAVAVVLIAGGLGSFGSWFFFGGPSWGVGLIAIGLLLWVMPKVGSGTRSIPPVDNTTTFAPPPAPVPTPAAVKAAEPKRRRYPIAASAILAMCVYVTITAVGDAVSWWHSSVLWVAVIALIIVITGILAGAIVNRHWFGVPLAVLLMAMLTALLVTHPNLNGGVGTRTVRPTTVAAATHREVLAAGQLTLDLSGVKVGETPINVRGEVGFGRLHVLVPHNAVVQINTDLGAGHVVVGGHEVASGMHQHYLVTDRPTGASTTSKETIVLTLKVGGGEIAIDRN